MKNEIILEKLNDVRDEFKSLVEKNGNEMYGGIFETINELENYDWEEELNWIMEDYEGEEESFINMLMCDVVDRVILKKFGEMLVNNLKKLGYKYDGEGWNIKDREGLEVTCYGFIWEFWYDLDTDVRESLGDIFEEICEEVY
jgi:hypothetical protein